MRQATSDAPKSLQAIVVFNGVLTLFIIIWGAWVRLSGSGAGCGEHWPLCHGEVVPLTPNLQTLIEFTHRLTSGIFGLTVLWQAFLSHKKFGKLSPLTRYSWALVFLTIVEALIGAVLVKKGLVTTNSSALRAWVIGLHLVNTLLLLGAWTGSFVYSFPKFLSIDREKAETFKGEKYFILLGLSLLLLVGAFGAITALGNTLFPSGSLVEGFHSDFSSDAPFLIQLRIYHPILAILMGVLWIVIVNQYKESSILYRHAKWCQLLIFIAIGFGALNWVLMAPHWGALLHLFIADILWISLYAFWVRRKGRFLS